MLSLRFLQCVGTIDLENLVSARDPQRRPGAQDVDIAAERFGIGLENGQHRLVHRQPEIGTHSGRYAPERVTTRNDQVATIGRAVGPVVNDRFGLRLRLWLWQ